MAVRVSFGAFVPHGVTLALEGDCNDYLGKGLSGGILSIRPAKEQAGNPEEKM